MNIIKTINNALNTQQQELQEVANIIYSNSTRILLIENDTLVCETATKFLHMLSAKIKNIPDIDTTNRHIRDKFGILAALDLLRYPQSRKTINSNSIRAFIDITLDIEGNDPLEPVEIKLLQNLNKMQNDEGHSGTELQAFYIHLARTDPKRLMDIINKLHDQYTQIINKIHYSTSTYSTHPSTDVEAII